MEALNALFNMVTKTVQKLIANRPPGWEQYLPDYLGPKSRMTQWIENRITEYTYIDDINERKMRKERDQFIEWGKETQGWSGWQAHEEWRQWKMHEYNEAKEKRELYFQTQEMMDAFTEIHMKDDGWTRQESMYAAKNETAEILQSIFATQGKEFSIEQIIQYMDELARAPQEVKNLEFQPGHPYYDIIGGYFEGGSLKRKKSFIDYF